MRAQLHRLTPFIGLALFGAALWVLRRELAGVDLTGLTAAVGAISWPSLAAAALLTAANYLVLTFCDQLAFAYLGKRLSRWRIGVVSFVGYAISNNLGFAILTGSSARYRFYARWGLTAQEISRIVVFYSSTFWLGLLVLGGWSLLTIPLDESIDAATGSIGFGTQAARLTGAVMLVLAVAYAVLPFIRRTALKMGSIEIDIPPPRLVLAQFAVSIVDWTLAVAVLHVLMPVPRPPFVQMVAAFLGAQLLALVSHVPGGIGIFESLVVLFLKPFGVTATTLLPALLVFRVIYYLVPLGAALVILLIDELNQRRHHVVRWSQAFGALAVAVTPKLLAAFTFVAGAVLLFSGATPAESSRLWWLSRFVPLPLLEASHFVGSLAGVGLLLVSHGLARRLDLAYYLATGGLGVGIVASLLKGGDYEEAVVLALVLALFVPSRNDFDRRASFFESRFSGRWIAAVLAVVVASVWLGLFAFRHVEYANDLWWQFELREDASRYLRATFGVTLALALFAITRLLVPARAEAAAPTDEELDDAQRVIDAQALTTPNLVFLRDKALLWNEARTAFLMYGVQGRTWVAMGDPVGPADEAPRLIRQFLERCDDYDALAVFYEVSAHTLYRYADFGLTFVKLGEEARVPLDTFGSQQPSAAAHPSCRTGSAGASRTSLDGSKWKPQRQAVRRLERDGMTFRVAPPSEVRAMLPELRAISDEWRQLKSAAEKGFSLGFFDEEYLARFPVGLVERASAAGSVQVVAFASLWPSASKLELSMDLMRHRANAPNGVMEGLLTHLMLWGRAEGYRWFNLGMAPLSGLEASDVTSLWVRLGAWIHEHGEAYYNFQGLRSFKDKFNPVWEPRYMAFPGGLSLPRVLADVSALIAGGYRKLLFTSRGADRARPARPESVAERQASAIG